MKCTVKNEVFLMNRSGENEGQSWCLSELFFETLIIILLVSSKLGDVIARFSYILLPQIKNDFFDHSWSLRFNAWETPGRGCQSGSLFRIQRAFLTNITLLFRLMGIFNNGHLQFYQSTVNARISAQLQISAPPKAQNL